MGRRTGRRIWSSLGAALALWAALALATSAIPAASATAASDRVHNSLSHGQPAFPGQRRPLARYASASALPAAQSGNAPPGRFPFQTATSADGLIVAHYYKQSADFGATFLNATEAALAHPVADTLGFTLKRRVDIYVYASRDDFLAGAPVNNPAETGALTACDVSSCAIYLEVGADNPEALADDLPHELTHAVFHQNEDTASIESFFHFFPLWLDEGLATHDETHDNYSGEMRVAAARGKLIDLLSDFSKDYPTDPDTDFLGYAEAHGFIGYLVDQYGRDALHGFLADARDGNLDLDAERHFGADLRVLAARWQASLSAAPHGVNLGYVPAAAIAPQPPAGSLSPVTTTPRPFPVDAGGVFPLGWLLMALACFAAAVVLMVLARRTRTEPPAGVLLALPTAPLPAELPTVPTGAPYPSSYEPALERDAVGSSPVATATAPVLDFPGRQATHPAAMPRWHDAALAGVAAPLVLVVGLVELARDPLHEWRQGFIAAALAALICLLAAVALALRERRAAGIPAFRALILSGLALLALVPWLSATPAGAAQGLAYESRGAYALALRYYADAGEPDDRRNLDLARVHRRWAVAAEAVRDHSTAVAQMRAAIPLDTALTAPGDRATLVKDVEAWGQSLLGAQQFDSALRVYDEQAASATCDGACHTAMAQDAAVGELAWGDAILRAGHPADAAAKYTAIVRDYAQTPAAGTARTAAREAAAQAALESALSAGERGDIAGMNAQLRAVTQQYPGTVAAGEAPATPEPVSGTVVTSRGVSAAGDRLFLLGFSSERDARAFKFDFSRDTSIVKVATTLGTAGAFTVRLQPGLWYVVCWNDATLAFNDDFNAPIAPGNDTFYVASLTPKDGVTVTGY